MKAAKPHWTEAIKKENDRLRCEIKSLKSKPMLDKFVQDIGETIMLQLSLKPFKDWPDVAKTAFHHEKEKAPTLAQMYINLLPEVTG